MSDALVQARRLVAAGLPEPELQVENALELGRRAFVDLGYRAARVGIELDGRDHERVDALFRDRWRQNAVHTQQWVLYRFTWRDIKYDGARFVATVARALADRGVATAAGDLSFDFVATSAARRSK